MMQRSIDCWTNPSVLALASDSDPIKLITSLARDIVLKAIQEGWQGPPYDQIQLAEYLNIPTLPCENVYDARIVPIGRRGVRIEYNPNRPTGRKRFSIAHEIAHTMFPDFADSIRNRGGTYTIQENDWQLEMLCNIAAAEFTMPIGTAMDLENEVLDIDNLLRLQKKFDVSTEAITHRLVKLTNQNCLMFAAAKVNDKEDDTSYRVDYSISSRSCHCEIPRGLEIRQPTVLADCTAVGFTAKGTERWASEIPEMYIECVGIPPYPRQRFPRVVGITQFKKSIKQSAPIRIKFLKGDATQPRGTGKHIIAHVVNDKTPNWGAGFAKYVKKKWPYVQRDFQEWAGAHRENLSLGKVHLSKISDDISIMHMIAQHGYGPSQKPRIRYAALRTCLDKLAEIAGKQRVTVDMPRIGAGQAGGNWYVIQELIDEALVQRGLEVTVYDLPSSEPQFEVQRLLSPQGN